MSLLIEALKRAELQRKQKAAATPPSEALPELQLEPPSSPPPERPADDMPFQLAVPDEAESATPSVLEFSTIALEAPDLPPEPPAAAPSAERSGAPAPLAPLSLADIEPPRASAAALTETPGAPASPPIAEAVAPPSPPAAGEPRERPAAPTATPVAEEKKPPPAAELKLSLADDSKLRAQTLKTMLAGQAAPAPGKRRLLLIALFGASALVGMGGYLWWLSSGAGQNVMLASPPPPAAEPARDPAGEAKPAAETENTPIASTAPPPPPLRQTDAKPAAASPPTGAPAADEARPPQPAATPIVQSGRKAAPRQADPADEAWLALRAGRTGEARDGYRKALKNDPRNREVLLGLAETAVRDGQAAQAIEYYERVLGLNPRDPDANAGIALLRGNGDPAAYETRLKTLLGEQPDSAGLHFALGALLAGQQRWHEAQQSFFQAATLAPDNPDYHFNLAVSLDQMGKYRNARDFYEKALALTRDRPGSFPRDAAQTRLDALADFIR